MSELPKISVITPCFNSARTIRETLESVSLQDYPNLEHLIIDGGSTDATLEIVREFPHAVCVSEKDEGLYYAMDKGIRMATGDAFVVMNSDDCFRLGVIRRAADAFAADPKWDGVFGDVVFVDENGREIFRRQEAMFDPQIVRLGHSMINHQAFFVRREVYLRLGGYRCRDFKSCCDYDFVMRMIRARCPIAHVPMFFVNYRYHDYGQSADQRMRDIMLRECAQIRAEHGVPGGWLGRALATYARIKRQLEKLLVLGKCDLIPGLVLLKPHLRPQTKFSSNNRLE